MKTFSLLSLALATTLGAAAPAFAGDGGGLEATAGAQLLGGPGLVGTFDFKADMQPMAIALSLRSTPNLTSFFYSNAHLDFVGRLGQYMPVLNGLSSVFGMGAAFLMRDVPKTVVSSGTDLDVYLYMPIGLRYQLPMLGLTADASYHLPVFHMLEGKGDLSRWRFDLSGRLDAVAWGVYYEQGSVFSGPGARVGMAF